MSFCNPKCNLSWNNRTQQVCGHNRSNCRKQVSRTDFNSLHRALLTYYACVLIYMHHNLHAYVAKSSWTGKDVGAKSSIQIIKMFNYGNSSVKAEPLSSDVHYESRK